MRSNGLNSKTPQGEDLINFTKKILNYSNKGLQKRKIFKNNQDESIFLKPLFDIVDSGKSPAKFWIDRFVYDWSCDIDMLYKTNYF